MPYRKKPLIVTSALIGLLTVHSFSSIQHAEAKTISPELQIGMFADAQYCQCEPKFIPKYDSERFFMSTPAKMQQATSTLNRKKLDFNLQLGDTIDRDYHSFKTMIPLYNQLKAPRYDVLGNHDFPNHDYSAMTALGMKHNYYSFVKKNIRFVVLDTNEISTYANPKGSKLYNIAKSRLKKAKAAGAPYAYDYNGSVTKKQLKWLDGTLNKAKHEKQQVIMISHHPVYPLFTDNVLNYKEILKIMDKYNNVQVYFNGHTHSGKYNVRRGVHYVNLKGMVETPEQNAYSVVKIYKNKMRIVGYGREETRTLNFRKIY
ncbi:metallophosphoesterase [Macrococcus lamae]|uniref:Calcineurin-like phosphoesterase domain-containing protein n=1 Tax=Macrococcus lamae TaxID=198484 RepID=A0A4V3BF10_9STAP|nr:metallophosphoesterase [Macrococcus lamae]TDM12273.1 hypothetical protein ERX29_04195 [Macrococcus lamae]